MGRRESTPRSRAARTQHDSQSAVTKKMIKDGKMVNFETTNGLPWTDIDTDEDLLLAKEIFIPAS